MTQAGPSLTVIPGSPGPESVELDSPERDSVSVASETSRFLILSTQVESAGFGTTKARVTMVFKC